MRFWPCPTKQRSNGNSGTTSQRKCGRKRSGSAASNSRAPGRSEALTRDARRCSTRGHYRASCPRGPQQCLHHCHGPNLQQRINLMSQAAQSLSTSVKIRFPRETLAALDDWAALNNLPRSVAVRRLILRSMTNWEDDPQAYCAGCEGGTGPCQCEPVCDCIGGPDTCTGNCR
jgi:hypothetical protein